jgi:predicted dehydrogenase/nucleoside-diphosphate-sugar epimerase
MGRHHAVAIQRLPAAATLVAVADADLANANALAADLGIPTSYGDFEKLLERERPDVVHICTSPASHFVLARSALEAGASVYIEKPFAETSAQARELLELAQALGRQVCAGHQLLFERPTILAKPIVDKLGAIQHVESYFAFRQAGRQDGRRPLTAVEQLLDILPHPAYLLVHFLGESAATEPLTVNGIRVDERGSVHALVSAGDVTGVLVASLHARPVDSYVKVVGTRGSVTLDYVRGIVVPSLGVGSTIDKILDPYSRAIATAGGSTSSLARRFFKKQRSYPGLADAFAAFYDHVATGAPAPVSASNIARTTELCDVVRRELDESQLRSLQRPRPLVSPTVAVTGGTGTLGREVIAGLVEKGVTPLVLSRRLPPPGQRDPNTHYASVDLGAAGFELPASIETVVHCAAETAGGWDAHQRNSIDATRNLLDAMRSAHTRQLVHVSSLAVIDADATQPLDETSPLERDGRRRGPYVWGKLESERIAAAAPRTHSIDVRIVRPGPLVDSNAFDPPGKLGRAVGRTFVAVGSPSATIPICDVAQAGRLIAWTATHFDEAEAVLHAIDPVPASRRSLVARVRGTAPPGVRVMWFPAPFLALASWAAVAAQKILRPRKPAVSLRAAFHSPRCTTERVRSVLDAMRESEVTADGANPSRAGSPRLATARAKQRSDSQSHTAR